MLTWALGYRAKCDFQLTPGNLFKRFISAPLYTTNCLYRYSKCINDCKLSWLEIITQKSNL